MLITLHNNMSTFCTMNRGKNILIDSKTTNIFYFMLVFFYSYCYVFLIPWDDFHVFADIQAYYDRMVVLSNNGAEKNYQGLAYIFSEPLWKEILAWISNTVSTDYYIFSLKFISFVSLFIYIAFTLKRVNIFIIALFFLNPMFIDLIMAQIRLALAFAFLLVAFEFRSKKFFISFLFLVSAVCIHTASLLFIGIFILLRKMNTLCRTRKFYFYSFGLSALLPIFLRFILPIILMAIGDRRANLENYPVSSITYSSIWLLLAVTLLFKAYYGDRRKNIIIAFSITMMGLFFFSSVVGLYGQRFVAVSIPLIIISINYLPKYYKEMSYILLAIYMEFQWLYWLELFIK